MLKKVEITRTSSFEYLRSQLTSEKILSKSLGEIDIESGKVFAFVPENISEEQLYNFRQGGLYPSEKELINRAWLNEVNNSAIRSRKVLSYILWLHFNW